MEITRLLERSPLHAVPPVPCWRDKAAQEGQKWPSDKRVSAGTKGSCHALQEQLKRLTVPRCKDENGEEEDEEEEEEQETANALNVLQMGSSSSVIAPLLSATSLPPVPPPLSPPSVNFLEDVVPPAPTWETLKEQEPLASVGSALHGTGNCKPCAWFWKPQAGLSCKQSSTGFQLKLLDPISVSSGRDIIRLIRGGLQAQSRHQL